MTLLTIQQAAERIATSERQLREFVRDGLIPYVNMGRGGKRPAYRFRPDDLDAFIGERLAWQERKKQACSSEREPRSINTISGYAVTDFTALRAQRNAARQKPLSGRERLKP